MIAVIATIVAIAATTLSDPYDYDLPLDRYDHYRIKKMPERTWNKQRRTAFWYIFHPTDRYNL